MVTRRILGVMLGSLLLAMPASASIVFGVVQDTLGAPVHRCDIVLQDGVTGDQVGFYNDATDPLGNYLIDVPNGFYNFVFEPPAPPDATLLPGFINGVTIGGTTDLGTMILQPGFALIGRAVDTGLIPIPNINLDAEDSTTNEKVYLVNDNTRSDGTFAVVLPAGTFDIMFDTTPSANPRFVPQIMRDTVISADLDLGDVIFNQGVYLSATTVDPGSAPVKSVDLNVWDVATGIKLYTPHDNTDSAGFARVTVDPGTYDVDFRPPVSTRLRGLRTTGNVVNTDTDLGTIHLQSGVILSGTVSDSTLTPVKGVRVKMFDPSSGAEIYIAWGRTKDAGDYAVVVPLGTWDLAYVPDYDVPLARADFPGTSIGGDLVKDVVLSDCASWSHYGTGTPGSGGFIPTLEPAALPRLGNPDFALDIANALGSTQGFIFLSLAPASLPGNGWTLLVDPTIGFTIIGVPILGPPVPGQGFLHLAAAIPDDPTFSGLSIYMQVGVMDPGAPGPLAASDGLELPLCR